MMLVSLKQFGPLLLLWRVSVTIKIAQSFTIPIVPGPHHRKQQQQHQHQQHQHQRASRFPCLPMTSTDDKQGDTSDPHSDGDVADESDSNNTDLHQQLQSRHEHLQVEKTRTALEEQHTQSFLKRRPRKLPYEDARKWVQANLGASTREEYDDMVANGNLRTPYIPKRPEEYYTATREWISWDHFLKGVFDDEQPSKIQPRTGVFD